MMPSPAELTYFLEVANSLNLSRASEKLGISQPSLSLAMKRLEYTVGVDLFFRHKQGVTLTQAGKQLFVHAKELLRYWENTKSRALASHQVLQGCFTLGCHSTMAIHTVSQFLPDFLENHPKVEILLRHDLSRKVAEKVINLSLDIGIVANPIKHPDLIICKLCNDEVGFWVGPGKRKIQDVTSQQAVLISDPDLTQTQVLLKKNKKLGLSFARMVTANSLEVVASLTANGCGIGILPARVVRAMYPNQLTQLPKTPVYKDELCLIYRNENRNVQAIQAIISAIKKHFAK